MLRGGSISGEAFSMDRVRWNSSTCLRQVEHAPTCSLKSERSRAESSWKTKSAILSVMCVIGLTQNRSQLFKSHIQPRFYGRNRSVLYCGDFFEFQTLKYFQHDNLALVFGQMLQRLFHCQAAFDRGSRTV